MLIDFLLERKKNELLGFTETEIKAFMKMRFIMGFLLGCVGLFVGYSFLMDSMAKVYIAVLLGFAIGYKYPYFKLLLYVNLLKEKNEQEFTAFVQAFSSLLVSYNNNVYETIVQASKYVGSPLKAQVLQLISNIEKHGDIREFYLELAHYISTSQATVIMDMIYQFSEQGVQKDALKQLHEHIKRMQENKMNFVIQKKESSQDTLLIIPIIISVVFFVSFIGIVGMYYLKDAFSMLNGING